jgi:hypothetical protein
MAAENPPPTAANVVATKPKPTETLSQFIARVLDQLSLSAWLPSAALVLAMAFIVQLGVVLDMKRTGPIGAIGGVLSRISATGIGGAVLLVVAIAVLAMLTQAFSFEAIRVLEGYWGTAKAVEWVAKHRARRHSARRLKLSKYRFDLTEKAWEEAKARIIKIEDDRRRLRKRRIMTVAMIADLESQVLGKRRARTLKPSQQERVNGYNWELLVDDKADLLRRRVNVDKRLRDYPRPSRILPTRLGNILRAHEDRIRKGRDELESLVQRIFDKLPPSLQESHDQQRNRLELYGSMTFVVALSGLLGIARFAPHHWPYAACAAGAAAAGTWIMYRAALATARAYGLLLVTIAQVAPPEPSASPGDPGTGQAPAKAVPSP